MLSQRMHNLSFYNRVVFGRLSYQFLTDFTSSEQYMISHFIRLHTRFSKECLLPTILSVNGEKHLIPVSFHRDSNLLPQHLCKVFSHWQSSSIDSNCQNDCKTHHIDVFLVLRKRLLYEYRLDSFDSLPRIIRGRNQSHVNKVLQIVT